MSLPAEASEEIEQVCAYKSKKKSYKRQNKLQINTCLEEKTVHLFSETPG